MRALRLAAASVVLVVLGCSSGEASGPTCPAGLVALGDACVPRADDCGALAAPALAGGCVSVGVPEGACAEGFTSDGQAACDAVLPTEACPKGTMAIPGEKVCRAVAPCGDAPFPEVGDDALFVDAAVTATGDGTRARPFATIGEAILKARDGSTVAIAAGTYEEDLTVRHAMRLIGRCPEKVVLKPKAATFTVRVLGSATLRGLSFTGSSTTGRASTALGVNAPDVVLEDVWIHDNVEGGVWVLGDGPATSVTLKNALVEDNTEYGVRVLGARATIERSVVRGSKSTADSSGAGVIGLPSETPTAHGSELAVTRSVVSGNKGAAVWAIGSRVTVSASALRETDPGRQNPTVSSGLTVSRDDDLGLDADADVIDTVIERCRGNGMVTIGGRIRAERVVIRDITEVRGTSGGDGVFVTDAGEVSLVQSVVRRATLDGIATVGGSIRLDRSLVDATRRGSASLGGFGVRVTGQPDAGPMPTAVLRSSIVASSESFGVYAFGAKLDLQDVAIRGVTADAVGHYGDGLTIMTSKVGGETWRASLSARGLWISDVARAGLSIFGADATLEKARITCSALDIVVVEQAVDLDAEGALPQPFTLDDRGGNACGCGTTLARCHGQPAELSPVSMK